MQGSHGMSYGQRVAAHVMLTTEANR
jgi:hypothetical protein